MVHGEKILVSARKWFERFKKGADNVEVLPHSGRPVEPDDESLKSLVEAEPQLTIDEIAENFNSSKGTIYRHLHVILNVEKWDF